MIRRLALLPLAAALAGAGEPPLRLPVAVASPGLQCLALPAAVLAAARSPGLADLRLVDARGRDVPMALTDPAPPLHRVVVPALPILAPAERLIVTGVSLSVDAAGGRRIARIDGVPAGDAMVVRGALYDTRAVSGPARSLVVAIAAPPGQPIAYQVESSRDLRQWRLLGGTVMFPLPGAGTTPLRVPLDGSELSGDWLRLTWQAVPVPPPVMPQPGGAPLKTQPPSTPPLPGVATLAVAVDPPAAVQPAMAPTVTDRHRIEVALPFATLLRSITVLARGEDVLVPFVLETRTGPDAPWEPFAGGIARPEGATIVPMPGRPIAVLRLVADPRSAGFTSPPRLEFRFPPRDLRFIARAVGAHVLTIGTTGAASRLLPAEALGVPARPCGRLAAPAPMLALTPPDIAMPARQRLLWAILLGASAGLAGLAWLLWRGQAR